jgi:endonuclease/exonuclease/phosphatase (EEP) superfamily protein YafD
MLAVALVLVIAAAAGAVFAVQDSAPKTVLFATDPAVPRKPPSTSALKLLQFNVLSATQGRDAGVAAVINASGADVVTLDEVAYKDIFDQIAARTHMYSVWVKSKDPFSVGILSRYPLSHCAPYVDPPMHHAAYGCRVTIHRKNWWIFGAHLSPYDENARLQEISYLLSQMQPHLARPVVLAGDFNTKTPGETEPGETKPLLVIPTLLKAGYVDSYRELIPLAQNPGFTISPPPWGHFEARLDYVFHSPEVRAVEARVLSSVPGYSWPSDHAALYVELIDKPALSRRG